MSNRRELKNARDRADYVVHRLDLLRRQWARVGRTSPSSDTDRSTE